MARLVVRMGVLCIGAAALGACYYPGGPWYSADRYTYVSTAWQPQTITLTDTRTGEVIWSQDVPVGKQLVIDFTSEDSTSDVNPVVDPAHPDMMEWEIMDAGTRFGQLDNAIAVPPADSRRVEMTLRPVPEYPATVTGAPTGPARELKVRDRTQEAGGPTEPAG
ncbi:MAG: hypothetical protein H7Y88_12975 [Phycisphaerales bacterium]|nr:hypothetical protein [Phycisphaerales bacterium]